MKASPSSFVRPPHNRIHRRPHGRARAWPSWGLRSIKYEGVRDPMGQTCPCLSTPHTTITTAQRCWGKGPEWSESRMTLWMGVGPSFSPQNQVPASFRYRNIDPSLHQGGIEFLWNTLPLQTGFLHRSGVGTAMEASTESRTTDSLHHMCRSFT